MVTGVQVPHARSDCFDHARGFVAEDKRRRERHAVAGERVEIAVTDARRHCSHDDFADTGFIDLDVANAGLSGN